MLTVSVAVARPARSTEMAINRKRCPDVFENIFVCFWLSHKSGKGSEVTISKPKLSLLGHDHDQNS